MLRMPVNDRHPSTMPKRISKITESLKELGDIQVNDWELPKVLNTELSELEIRKSLQKLSSIQVTEWEIRDIMPALQELARKEVDIVGLLRQAAEFKVNDWELKDAFQKQRKGKPLSKRRMTKLIESLSAYLEYVIFRLIKEPRYASIHCEEIAPQVLCFRVILTQRDLSALIGSQGRTAGPIRRILKDVAYERGVFALLSIQTHMEAARTDGI